jgi:N-acetylglucosamine-6-phosphate deacetylase
VNKVSALYKNGKIYASEQKRFLDGSLSVSEGLITGVYLDGNSPTDNFDETIDLSGNYLIPGLIDVHTHGRAGGDFNTADANVMRKMSKSYIRSGVTATMATLASATPDELFSAIEKICEVTCCGDSAYIGVHLEGRYLNGKRRGAHAAHLLAKPQANEIAKLVKEMKKAGYAHVSAALELDEDGSFTSAALDGGATLGLAHSDATFAEGQKAFARGAVSLTHTYNAMSPFHHRDGGAVGAGLLTDGVFCELICDGFHVSPEAVKMAYKLKKDNIVLITDSMEATDMPDGEYFIAGLPVTVKDGRARTHEGAIAGSTLSLIDGVKNLAAFADIPFSEAIYCATASPAKMIGAYGTLGSLDKGKKANMLIIDKEYNVKEVIFQGKKI